MPKLCTEISVILPLLPSSLSPTSGYANRGVHVASWSTRSQEWSGQKNSLEFDFRFLFSAARSAHRYISTSSCINSWLWRSSGRGVGWIQMSKREAEPGLFKLPFPSERCSKNHSLSCMKFKSTALENQLLSVPALRTSRKWWSHRQQLCDSPSSISCM